MALLGYPEWAMMKNRQGEDVPKPWVTGASPVSQALLATGLGILADRPNDSGWVQEGGIDLSGIGRGGLLGLQQYVDATRNLHDSRKDFYSRLADTQNQLRANRRFQEEQRLTRIAEQEKQRMIDNFPAVLETINKTGRPEFQQSVKMLEAMFAADPGKAAAAAMNIISQIKTPPGEVKTHDIPGTDSVYITQGGIYKGTVKGTSAGGGVEKLDKKAYDGLLYNANQEPDEFTADQYFQLYSGRQQLDVKDKKLLMKRKNYIKTICRKTHRQTDTVGIWVEKGADSGADDSKRLE